MSILPGRLSPRPAIYLFSIVLISTGFVGRSSSQERTLGPTAAKANPFLANRPFVHIPGPNPIISRGNRGAWDEAMIEACDVIKDSGTYYFYYHGIPVDFKKWSSRSYRIGLATAQHPLGPWTKYRERPVLDVGSRGSWEDQHVACAFILKEKPGKYLMWYSGKKMNSKSWDIGIATASKPEGPWRKYEKNPVLKDFGYVGGVINLQGKYYLYTEHPIGSTAQDYGPISLAVADSPEGPWTIWKGNPVLPAGNMGAWDDAGYSEAKVMYLEGMFHMFYGGAKEYVPRRLTRESIGYAYSSDGMHFTKYGGNPVARREANPNTSAYAEVHTLYEPPFVYAFHTIRYVDTQKAPIPGGIEIEDLGVEVLAPPTAFSLPMPILTKVSLAGGMSTNLPDSPPINLGNINRVTLTAECGYGPGARAGMRVHVRSSANGTEYDTTDLFAFDNDFQPDAVRRKTVELKPKVRYIKVLAENLDGATSLRDVKVTATLSR